MGAPLKITVATVTYNAAALIEATIASVERQNYPWVEHLIVDGNSRDDTLAHVHRYQERNSVAPVRHEIVCISEPDDGLYDAMNKALELATGSYIVFLNAGDRLHDADTLSRVARAAQGTAELPAVVYGNTDLVDAEGRFVRHRRLAPPPREPSGLLRPHRPGPRLPLRLALPLLGRLRLVRAPAERGGPPAPARAGRGSRHGRLSERRPHHAKPPSLAPRAFCHHGAPLRPRAHPAAPRMVCGARRGEKIRPARAGPISRKT